MTRHVLHPDTPLEEVRERLAGGSRIAFRVHGTPAPQGSKRGFVNKAGGVSMVESSAKVKPWRQDVKYAALEARHVNNDGLPMFPKGTPLLVTVDFILARPKGHYRTGKNAHLLRESAPKFPASKPDLDKLLRSTLDALGEAGVWHDDSQVVSVLAAKWYADDRVPGADITVEAA